MNSKSEIETILKKRFFVTPTGYPPLNGFLDYGPALTQIKQRMLIEFRKIFIDETVYEIEPSAVLPYEVLKNSGHIDRFCDVIISDGQNIFRADHYLNEKLGETVLIPVDLKSNTAQITEKMLEFKLKLISEKRLQSIQKSKKSSNDKNNAVNVAAIESLSLESEKIEFTKSEVESILNNFKCIVKPVSDLDKTEIDFTVSVNNFYSPEGLPFQPSKDFNLIFNLTGKQFLRPELAQSQFTNFRKLFEMNGEKLPFSSFCVGRSYRNEISARGGMLRTKEFEQAELEYFTEDGDHVGFDSIRDITACLLPNTHLEAFSITLGQAYDDKIISSKAICYFIAKALEFCSSVGFKPETLRLRQHSSTEMAHYANDCWDVEIKLLSGWIECVGIADRSNFDLTVHSKDVNTLVKRIIPQKVVYDVVPNKKELGGSLKSKMKDFEQLLLSLDQDFIVKNMKNNKINIDFEDNSYSCDVQSRKVDCEFFIPRVIEPSFGISRLLYALVEQNFNIRDERNVLSVKPKMAYLHCVIGFLKSSDEFEKDVAALKNEFKENEIRFRITERGCSIGKKYSSFDELGVPFFITFDIESLTDKKVTIRERDTMTQIRVPITSISEILSDLIKEKVTWNDLFEKNEVK